MSATEDVAAADVAAEDVAVEIGKVFAAAGARGFLHAREVDVDDGPQIEVGADEPVVLASVFKIPVAVAYSREVTAGRLDPHERVRITSRYRIGGIGTAGCADDVELSWGDAARFMLTMSDNAATDTIYHRIGRARVDAVLSDLDLHRTHIIGCCEDLFASVAADLGRDNGWTDIDAELAATPPERVWSLAVLDPERTSSSTPRETTTLLAAIWSDRAGEPETCARVRDIMADQIWPHRISSGFESDVRIAAKTGTLPSVRNEAGVITYPDGRRYAVAVFTRAQGLAGRQPAIDAAIGSAARLAVESLRG